MTNRAPIIHGCSLCISQSRRDNFEIRKLCCRALNHATEIFDIEFRVVKIQSFYLESKTSSEVFFITQHHVDQRSQCAIDFLSSRFAADRFP